MIDQMFTNGGLYCCIGAAFILGLSAGVYAASKFIGAQIRRNNIQYDPKSDKFTAK